jgi:hypothetical protein
MIWVGLRQQRTETLVAAGILILLAVLLVPTGLQMTSAYHHDNLSSCLGDTTSFACGASIRSFMSRFAAIGALTSWLTLLPGLVGVLLAAPFVLEIENGTYRLAWTQSITRGRWVAGKLAIALCGSILFSLAFTLLVTWWRTPFTRLEGRMDTSVFDSEGIVVFGYTLFALGLVLAIGILWRRAVPALLVGFGLYIVTRVFVDTWLRQRLVTPVSATWSSAGPEPAGLGRAWVLSEWPSDKLGHAIPSPIGPCIGSFGGHAKAIIPNCVARRGEGFTHTVFQPASHFWPIQLIETGIFGGIALALVAFAAWWTHERVA